jgi:hypothetical protein
MYEAWHLAVTKRNLGNKKLIPNLVVVSFLLCLTGLTAGCGSLPQSAGAASTSNSSASVSLSPNNATMGSSEKLQFTARISGTPNTAVTWSASAGTISKDGIFTAPSVSSSTPVTVTVTSAATAAATPVTTPVTTSVGGKGGSSSVGATSPPSAGTASSHASATVTVTAPAAVAIATSALPTGDAATPYTTTLSATGGVSPYRWSLPTGVLPSGIQLQASSGVIAGTTTLVGSFPVTAKVTDAAGHTATAPLSLTVSTNSNTNPTSGFDGPAELPRVYIQSAMSNTPTSGTSSTVSSAASLQAALDNAKCGDTIQLQAGATFTGTFTLPAKSCDATHWIIVRTSADDSVLPAEGNRLTPCYAGVSSLPSRPAFNCASTKNVLAKLVMAGTGNGPIAFASGASHYRLIGLEVTRVEGTGTVTALASVVNGGTANNLIFDRVWMHGTAQDETTRGVWLEGATYVSIVDSFFTDFHCISSTGSCTDSQAIAGGLGSNPGGPYKIAGNFLEASGENILFGGGAATLTPADIEISHNHMFKPLTWMKGQAGYVGGKNGNPFIVKNLIEVKNAQRVLLDSNRLEDSWGGFSQVGFAIVLTPKNQSGSNGSNLCPVCQVTDVTIRYNSISHVGAGLQIANALSDNGGTALDGQRYSIHDIVIDDIDGVKYNGPSEFAQISVNAGAPLLQNVTINHITAFPTTELFMIGDQVAISARMKNFVFTNSIVNAGTYPIWSTGNGGATNCAYSDVPVNTLAACFNNFTFVANAILAPPGSVGQWPLKNFFPASASTVQFVNYNGGIGGDYRLQSSSPYKAKGTDGKDLGADLDAVNTAIAGVE